MADPIGGSPIDDEIKEEDVSDLSPFKVLPGKNAPQVVPPPVAAPTPLAAAAPAAPVAPGVTREELLKQAAEAPEQSFILPPPGTISATTPPAAPAPVAVPPTGAIVPPPLTMELDKNQTVPVTKIVKPLDMAEGGRIAPKDADDGKANVMELNRELRPVAAQSAPSRPSTLTPPRPGVNVVAPMSTLGAASVPPRDPKGMVTIQAPPRARRSLMPIVLILIVVLLAGLVGTGYVMAKNNGTRVPYFYKMVSGLEPNAKGATSQAYDYVGSQTSYGFIGKISLNQQSSGTSGAPVLSTSDQAGSVTTLSAEYSQGQFSNKGANYLGNVSLAVNGKTPIPAALKAEAKGSADTNWSFYFSQNSAAEVLKFNETEASKSLLYPMLKPIPLEKLLPAFQQELAYALQTTKKEGAPLAAYKVALKADDLKSFFPDGATLQNPTLTIRYAWSGSFPTAQPASAEIDATMVYKQLTYVYSSQVSYQDWGKPIDTQIDVSFSKLSGDTSTAKTIDLANLIGQFGILGLDSLPNTIGGSSGTPVVTPSPSPSPSATATATPTPTASPSPSPSASGSGMVTPTGNGITVVGSAITTNPPVPTSPASEAAKIRDAQRLKDLTDLKTALLAYKAAKGSFPKSLSYEQTVQGTVLVPALVGTYITKLPTDPVPSVYWYQYKSDGSTFTLRGVAEDSSNAKVTRGSTFYFYEITN